MRLEVSYPLTVVSSPLTPLLDSTQNARLVCISYSPALTRDGAVAQLGERMTGSHEVRGSIPLGSTNSFKHLK
jgi:hypothetical protein